MRTFSYDGTGSDGTQLIPGHTYMARATGAPHPKTGELREPADADFRPYKAVRNGSLYSMWPLFGDDVYGYRLPQYLEFETP